MAAKTTATAVSATSLTALNSGTAVTYVLAENSGTNGTTDTEFFEITVSQNEPHSVILLNNFNSTATSTLRYTLVAPTGTNAYWAAGSDFAEGTIAGGGDGGGNVVAINIEGAKFKNTSGKIRVNVAMSTAGATTGGLAAVAKIAYVQLP